MAHCCIPQHIALCHSIVLCAAVMFLCAMARNNVLQHCLMFCTIILHSAARNNALLHSAALHIMPWHGASCHGIVCYAMAMFCCHATTRMGKQSTCAALAAMAASWYHFGLSSCGVFAEAVCFVFF